MTGHAWRLPDHHCTKTSVTGSVVYVMVGATSSVTMVGAAIASVVYSTFPYKVGATNSVTTEGAAIASVMYSTFPYMGAAVSAVVVMGTAARSDTIAAVERNPWARSAGASMSFPVANSSLTSTTRSSITRPPARRLLGLLRGPAGLRRFMPPSAVGPAIV